MPYFFLQNLVILKQNNNFSLLKHVLYILGCHKVAKRKLSIKLLLIIILNVSIYNKSKCRDRRETKHGAVFFYNINIGRRGDGETEKGSGRRKDGEGIERGGDTEKGRWSGGYGEGRERWGRKRGGDGEGEM